LTCAGNDVGFDQVFALPLSRFARADDMLITISSSGASQNILEALELAHEMRLQIVTISGRSANNPSRSFGDINIYVPTLRYGWIESGHHVVLHYWLDRYLDVHGQGAV
jgi:D-sedoheptulose 7-phosphate isomerase